MLAVLAKLGASVRISIECFGGVLGWSLSELSCTGEEDVVGLVMAWWSWEQEHDLDWRRQQICHHDMWHATCVANGEIIFFKCCMTLQYYNNCVCSCKIPVWNFCEILYTHVWRTPSDRTNVMQTPAWSSPGQKAVSLIRAWSCHNQPVVAFPCRNSLVEAD